MIVFNTTYHAENLILDEFIQYLKEVFIPAATASGEMLKPRLTQVITHEQQEGTSLALQFEIADVEKLDDWYDEVGETLNEEMTAKFGQKVAGFSTLLEEIEL